MEDKDLRDRLMGLIKWARDRNTYGPKARIQKNKSRSKIDWTMPDNHIQISLSELNSILHNTYDLNKLFGEDTLKIDND